MFWLIRYDCVISALLRTDLFSGKENNDLRDECYEHLSRAHDIQKKIEKVLASKLGEIKIEEERSKAWDAKYP